MFVNTLYYGVSLVVVSKGFKNNKKAEKFFSALIFLDIILFTHI